MQKAPSAIRRGRGSSDDSDMRSARLPPCRGMVHRSGERMLSPVVNRTGFSAQARASRTPRSAGAPSLRERSLSLPATEHADLALVRTEDPTQKATACPLTTLLSRWETLRRTGPWGIAFEWQSLWRHSTKMVSSVTQLRPARGRGSAWGGEIMLPRWSDSYDFNRPLPEWSLQSRATSLHLKQSRNPPMELRPRQAWSRSGRPSGTSWRSTGARRPSHWHWFS